MYEHSCCCGDYVFISSRRSSCCVLLWRILQSETGVVMSGKHQLTGSNTDTTTVLQPNRISKFLLLRPKTDGFGGRMSGRYVSSYGCYFPPDMRCCNHNFHVSQLSVGICFAFVPYERMLQGNLCRYLAVSRIWEAGGLYDTQ